MLRRHGAEEAVVRGGEVQVAVLARLRVLGAVEPIAADPELIRHRQVRVATCGCRSPRRRSAAGSRAGCRGRSATRSDVCPTRRAVVAVGVAVRLHSRRDAILRASALRRLQTNRHAAASRLSGSRPYRVASGMGRRGRPAADVPADALRSCALKFSRSQSTLRSPSTSVQVRTYLVDRTLGRVGVGIDAVDPRTRQILAHVPLDRRLAGAEDVPRHAPPRGDVVVGDAVRVGRAVAVSARQTSPPTCTGTYGSVRAANARSRVVARRMVVADRAAQREPLQRPLILHVEAAVGHPVFDGGLPRVDIDSRGHGPHRLVERVARVIEARVAAG